MHPMGHYAATELKLKRVFCIVEDFAFGYEQMGGFQEVFEKYGGRVVEKLWAPIVTPDYAPYLVQIRDSAGVCEGFAGSNPLKFMQQYAAVAEDRHADVIQRHARLLRVRTSPSEVMVSTASVSLIAFRRTYSVGLLKVNCAATSGNIARSSVMLQRSTSTTL